MSDHRFIPLSYESLPESERLRRVKEYHDAMKKRRSVRSFSADPVPIEAIEWAIRSAGLAPSGANLQPWHFVIVNDPETKARIREAAEQEERLNYEKRFPQEWKRVLEPLGTDWKKEYLEIAPHLIAVFATVRPGPRSAEGPGEAAKHYYVTESVGIATGFLLSALHLAGLATLTHTPSPMGFLRKILRRPANERAYVLIPVGHPAHDATVPDIEKKPLGEIMTRFEKEP